MKIAAGLAALAVPIDSIQPHPDNPWDGDDEGIATSLKRFGQLRPILVQKSSGYIVAGNHTYRGAVRLGADRIAANLEDLTDEVAEAYLIADNRWHLRGSFNDEALVKILARIEERGALEGTGYDVDDVEDLRALLGKLDETESEPFTGGYAEHEDETQERTRSTQAEPMREVVLLLPTDRAKLFAEAVRELQERYGLSGVTDTVFRAILEHAGKPVPA